ncbi:MAG: Acetolactate synthase isozyme 3 large subunit [Alphaproteobacteria bacterium MarineAlpha4_Bin2]|nr:MAG: Acetolactate synthase isozyme 3 large subunit [Alphaproteobacteria bacterium MarineAlpha4_Bin2]
MKVYEAVLEQLWGAGVTHFAGMVGSTSAPYASALAAQNRARYVGIRHEQVGASILDATARLSGRPGVLMVHGGSGLLAASLGVAAAALDGTPMVVLSATQERTAMENGWWQTLDVQKPVADFVKFQTRVERPDQAVTAVRDALRESVSGKPGVAQIDIPIDVSVEALGADVAPLPIPVSAPLIRPFPDPLLVSQAADLIRHSERPVLLIGGGAHYSGAGNALMTLIKTLHIPVVNSPTSRGVLPETHPLVLGCAGIIGYEPVGSAITEADLVLAVGSRLSDIQTSRGDLLPKDTAVIQVDINPDGIGREYPVAVGIVSDAKAFTEALNAELANGGVEVPNARREWTQSLASRYTEWRNDWIASEPDNGQVQPQEIVAALIEQPPATIFTHGAGDHGFYGFMAPVDPPGAHVLSTRLGAMGCALGLSIGAKWERPDQPVICCIGDGDLMLQLGDLETLARERMAAVLVVFNNFRLGSQRKRVEAYGPVIGVDHNNPDFAKLAELFDCRGYRVDKPRQFAGALNDALSSGEPAVIDVIVDPDARPPRIAMSREAR